MSKKRVYVLGINAYDHDVSACLLRDGEIAYAIAKERITRKKHDTGFYQRVVDYCLAAEGISLDDVDLVVRNCYVLPVEDLEIRMVSQDVPEVMDDGHILRHHAYFQVLHRQDIAVAYYQIDIVQRDAFGRQTVVDDPLVKTGIVLLSRYALFGDRVRNLTV